MKIFFTKAFKCVAMYISLLLSRTLLVTLLAAHLLYKIYWTADQAIWTFKEQWQASAHVQLFGIMFGSISALALGYLGFTKGSTGIAGFVQSTFSRSTSDDGIKNRNSKADRD